MTVEFARMKESCALADEDGLEVVAVRVAGT